MRLCFDSLIIFEVIISYVAGTGCFTQGNEAKKEEFRKYLEKTGVVDQLTRVLVGLYE